MREARAGDRYLLCSDGLSGVVSEETLAHALEDPDPQSTADRLIELALRGGGPDNITVIVADVVDDHGRGGGLDVPVVDGAAGDGTGQRQIDPRSAAGRAALADPPSDPPPTPTPPSGGGAPPRRRPLRILVVAVVLLALLVGGGVGTYAWAMTHWFVGATGTGEQERVGVYRGLDVSIVGWDLFRLDETTSLAVGDLTPDVRSRVRGGITADDARDAERILETLHDERLPVCREIELFPDGAASGTATSTPSPSPSAGRSSPAASRTTSPAAPRSASRSATPSASSAPSTSAAPRTTLSGEPGVDCREEDG
jgi:hypothetical protein